MIPVAKVKGLERKIQRRGRATGISTPAPPFGRCRSTRPAATLGSVRLEPAALFPSASRRLHPAVGHQDRGDDRDDKNAYADGLRDRASASRPLPGVPLGGPVPRRSSRRLPKNGKPVVEVHSRSK